MNQESSQYRLLTERRFAPLFVTQFFGAFNDNVFKNALVILLAFHATTGDAGLLVNLAAAIFILPFFLFSATAGQLAEKYEKSAIARYVKILEIGIMLLGAAGFALASVPLLMAALFLLGAHSTLFGPVKYSILPQHLRETELVGGNGLIEMGTFLAILLGTLLGGALIAHPQGATLWIPVATIAIAIAGYLASRGIPTAPPTSPQLRINWNPATETIANLRFLRTNRTVFLSVLGISWFWFYGAIFLSQFPSYAKDWLGGSEQVVTVLLATFSVGIGLGSMLCERLSGHKVEIGLVPFGSIGLTVFAVDLWFASPAGMAAGPAMDAGAFLAAPGSLRILFDLAAIGVFGGFYIVPLYALIQSRSERSHQSRVIAGNNIMNALFMVGASLLAIGLLKAGLDLPTLFLVTALMNAAVAVYIYSLVPEFLMRFIVWMLIHSVYRLEKSGLERIPDDGPAIIVANHVSFVDALVIAAACPRPIRFVMDHHIFRLPVLSFVFRTNRAIPIAPAKEDPKMMERAFEEVGNALRAGDLVAIFPEGRITDTGEMYPFRPGITRILASTPVPVIPVALRGLWGSFFSRVGGAAMTQPWRTVPFRRIALAVGEAVPVAGATPETLQARVLALRGDWK